MNDQRVAEVVDGLLDAYRTGTPVAPPTETHAGFTVDQAYEAQLAQVTAWRAQGRVVRGHKVGLTSVAIQRQLNVDSPDYGHLLEDMFIPDSTPIPVDRFIAPRVEPEIGFVLKKTLSGPGVTASEAIGAVDYAVAALEIIDSRIEDWRITLADTIADNASSGGIILGSRPLPLDQIDVKNTGVVLYRNGEIVQTGAGGAVLGSPINALVWLANTIGALGVTLEAGSVVLPGALTAAVPGEPGDTVTAEFAGLGTVTAQFASSDATDVTNNRQAMN
ncbi:2-keto-4-pentenoate hydratase [Leucobacter sp. Psy1]|uniref:2-keto-4-pentenoate hydratase n=1 Tax=Leucobacter sp. Psy1 TaxID=2875729 RepID=UPI001CD6025F|nr:2-keto-4-pentenoate hydratase [Leucobacter sp. Psy1]